MSILPEKIERYRKFFGFMIKYANSDLVNYASEKAMDNNEVNDSVQLDISPEELTEDLKNMGPAYIKLGQLLSTRPDLLPQKHLDALCALQDDVEEIPLETVREVFEKEIGTRISKAFDFFDEKPLASASIGQVHKARLHSGKLVAVKIQRPNVREKFLSDLDTLQEMANWAIKHSEDARKYNVADLIEELRHTLLNELNYESEAQNLNLIRENLKEFKRLQIPMPITDYSSSKVLTMEFIEGKKATKINPLRRIENDLTPLVDDLVKGYLKQIIVDGFAHADPHPGNIHITPYDKFAMMDLGMVAQFPEALRDQIMQLLIGLSNYDSQEVIRILMEISTYDSIEATIEKFQKEINRLLLNTRNKKAGSMQTGRFIIQVNRIAASNSIKLPVELNMLAKILLNLDQIVAVIAPDYDVNRTIKAYAEDLMKLKMAQEFKPGNVFNIALEAKKLAEQMPNRLNTIFKRLSDNEFEIKVNAIDEKRFTDAFQKLANRITMGVIIAAMIIGAAMLMRVQTSFTIMGYPGLAIILFLLAAIIGFYVLYQIIVKDENFKKK